MGPFDWDPNIWERHKDDDFWEEEDA